MNVQRGLVKDLGFEDTECTYVTGIDGVQYYFVNETKLVDGLYVVTPNVKEAVKHEPYSTLGVMDESTKIIIPCDNKRIEVLAGRFLLVEKTEVQGKDVKASLAVKDDPIQANTYNNDSLNIKHAMENQMGSGANFVFDDMYSEANLYDFTGKKVLGEDSTGFSFIGQVGNDLYLHTIDLHDSIKVIKSPAAQQEPTAPANNAPLEPTVSQPTLVPEVTEEPAEDIKLEGNQDVATAVEPAPVEDTVSVTPEVDPIAPEVPIVPVEPIESPVVPEVNVTEEPVVTDEAVSLDAFVNPTVEDTKVEEADTSIDESSKYKEYIRSPHEDPEVKNAVYDEAVEVIKGLMDKKKELEEDNESKGVRIKELELDNEAFAKTIKEQKELIDKLKKEKEEHIIEIRRQKKSIESLEVEKKDFLTTIEVQRKKIEEQDKQLRVQDEELTKHESGKEELVKLLENATEVLN